MEYPEAVTTHYGNADNFEPKSGQDYSWVLDYAKFRFQWAGERVRYIESKCLEILKLLMALGAGIGAALAFFLGRGTAFNPPSLALLFLAVGFFLVAAQRALSGLKHKESLFPLGDRKST